MTTTQKQLTAKEMLAKYPNDAEQAMIEYARQAIQKCWEKSRISIVSKDGKLLRYDECALIKEEYNDAWVAVDRKSILDLKDKLL